MTMTLIGRLARRQKAPVLFCCAIYDKAIGKYRLHHFEGEAAIGSDSAEEAAAALNRGVERLVRRFPESYQWTYRRFELPGAKRRDNPYRKDRD
jgi:KDO2-lipid IV(A) lauroyltransferase